jgi:deazaflavin-dependent oxidoreductase (nitroreductase family)
VTDDRDARKRRRVTLMQRYLLNPPVKAAVWTGLAPGYVLIETRGAKTGKRRRNVVGIHMDGDVGWVVAEQGRHAGYVANLVANPDVRVRLRGRWRPAHAEVVPDDDADARLSSFGRRTHAATLRMFGTALTSVRIDVR